MQNNLLLIEKSKHLTNEEMKLFFYLFDMIQTSKESNTDTLSFNIDFSVYQKIMNINYTEKKKFLNSIKELYNFTITFKYCDEIKFIHLIDNLTINNKESKLIFKINLDFITNFISTSEQYYALSIKEILSLQTNYAILIYGIIKARYQSKNDFFEYKIDYLKDILNLEDKYTLYGDFRRFVIDSAVEQINNSNYCDFNLKYKEIKDGKSVASIEFEVTNKCDSETPPIYNLNMVRLLTEECLKDYSHNKVICSILKKIEHELKSKKPNMNIINTYVDTITTIINN